MSLDTLTAGIPEAESLRTVFGALHEDVVDLIIRWELYRELYRQEREQIDLLNQKAPFFFASIQVILRDNVLSRIARISDKPTSSGQPNLTLRQLLSRLGRLDPKPGHWGQLEKQLVQLESVVDPIRQVRHKRLSHSDLHLVLSPEEAQLPHIPESLVDDVIRQIADFLHGFQFPFTGRSIGYLGSIAPPGGGRSLVGALRQAAKYRELFWKGLVPSDDVIASTPDVTL